METACMNVCIALRIVLHVRKENALILEMKPHQVMAVEETIIHHAQMEYVMMTSYILV